MWLCVYLSEGFTIGRMWIVVSDELEDAVRNIAKRKGDLSKLFEEAMRIFLRERGVKIKEAEN